jgi:hypothetical protein
VSLRVSFKFEGSSVKQARPEATRLRIADCGLGTDLRRDACPAARRLARARSDCAKRTQFGPRARKWARTAGAAERELCETNPIWPGRMVCAQNKAKLGGTEANRQRRSACRAWPGRGVKRAKRTQFRPPQAADGGNCAKRSRTWGGLGQVGKGGQRLRCGPGGSETCETNPIWPGRTVSAQNKANLAVPTLRERATLAMT